MQNAFLKDFMRMRQTLHTKAETIPGVSCRQDIVKSKVLSGVKGISGVKGQGHDPDVDMKNITLATILEKKPSQKIVLEYFRKRALALEAEAI